MANEPNEPSPDHQPPNRQQPQSGSQGQPEQTASGGRSWWKWLLGCGCLAIMLLVCTGGVAVVGAGWYVTSSVKQIADAEIATQEQVQERRKLLETDELKISLDEPVRASEFRKMNATVDTWKNSEAVQDLLRIIEDAEDGGDPQTVWETIEHAYRLWQVTSSIQKVGTAYLEAIDSHGGMKAHYKRMVRTGAVVAAVHEVASGRKFPRLGEPPSDAVAEVLHEKHAEVIKKYRTQVKRLKGAAFEFEKMMGKGDLGTWALANLPADSFGPWHAMSEKERQTFIEHVTYATVGEALVFRGDFLPKLLEGGLQP